MHPKIKEELKNKRNLVNIDNISFNFKNTDSTNIYTNGLLKRKGYDITIYELKHTCDIMLTSISNA